MGLQVDFVHHHVRYIVIIVEYGNLPHPQFPCCKILVPWEALNSRHRNTTHCTIGAGRKLRRLVAEESRESTQRDF